MKKEIYIIEGNSGEYSDRCNWLVKGFFSKEGAQQQTEALNAKLKELGLLYGFEADWETREKNSKIMKQLDPQFTCDYTGTEYMLLTVEIEPITEIESL